MMKHLLLLIGFSIAAIFFKNDLVHVVHGILLLHNKIASGLGVIFSGDSVGRILQSVIALMFIPVTLGTGVAVAHWFIKQVHFPHTLTVIWVTWAILLATMLAQVA